MNPFLNCRIVSRLDLRSSGLSPQGITAAVKSGELLRVRRDHYALPDTDRHTLEAVRIGGREACVSAAREIGFFAFDTQFTHVHLDRQASRLRSPGNRNVPLVLAPRGGVELHWRPLIDLTDGTEFCVGARDALAQIIQCQEPRFALAALDTALHERKIQPTDLSEIFASVPARHHELRARIDARVDAGQESVLRDLFCRAGLRCDIQVTIGGIGRVDLLVEGCVVVEADSYAYHRSWPEQVRDHKRNRLLAERRYLTLRVPYEDIMFHPEAVLAAIRELVLICRNGSDRALLPFV
ncbi:type IV toxin-antitoxin system AbiEi family antitoxin domain-containing protein [Cryobacterium melibiosiphilum]|uniref:type IV toxin-antitoxin system AbiEi family antitoxin domain-containing protein n=1 Tax=Cryobacterium melibiosiphilum TaxID=995039 RepID=UPI00131474D2|nr:type IV toxin-antitoxin system AbiEi family antitoxin domain-containing protein [Cryobacterium melibiosiphilum]